MEDIKALRKTYGVTQKYLSDTIGIPVRTIQNWEAGVNTPPAYLVKLLEYWMESHKREQ